MGVNNTEDDPNIASDESVTMEAQGFVCPTCMTTFQSSEYLKSHFEGVHGNVCPVCMVGFNGQEKLEEHYEAEHGNMKTNFKENQFRKILGQLTKRERTSSRNSTNSIESPEYGRFPEYSDSLNTEIEGNFCPICMKQFDCPEDLGEHYERDHVSENETLKEKILSSQFVKTMKMMKLKERLTFAGSTDQIETKPTTEDESFLYKNQIAALEESKVLLVSEVVMLRKQVGSKESSISNTEIIDMKVDDLKLAASDDSEFVNLCIQKLSILDDKMTEHRSSKNILEEKLKQISKEQKALEDKYQESLDEKKELVSSYDTLIKFKDRQLEDMKTKMKEKDEIKEPSKKIDEDKDQQEIESDKQKEGRENDNQIDN